MAASAPLLQTESTQVGAALDTKTVTDVPLGGTRNLTYLARLSPGVVPAEPGARDSANGGFSANGVRSNGQNNFLLNGVDNNINTIDFLNQTSYAIGPAIDAVSEISIQTNGYNAEYGRAAGGVINVTLKSGTNALHGSLFEYLQNRDLDANTWTNNRAGAVRADRSVQNQFGATAGGPIMKNKLFIFGDYQGTRIADSGGSVTNLGYSGYTTIPTAAMKAGNFSSLLGPAYTGTDVNGNPISIQKGAIYDPQSTSYCTSPCANVTPPVSRSPCRGHSSPGISFPLSRMDPAWAKIMQLYPNPNQAVITGNAPTNDYYYNTTGALTTDQGDARVDYRLSDKDSLFGSLSWSNTSKTDGAPLPGALDDTGFNGAGEIDLSPQRADELYPCLEPEPGDGKPPRLHAPGDVAHRSEPEHRPVHAVRYRRLRPHRPPRPITADFRRSVSPTAIRPSAPPTGFRPRNTTTFGISSRTSRSARARTPISSASNSAP